MGLERGGVGGGRQREGVRYGRGGGRGALGTYKRGGVGGEYIVCVNPQVTLAVALSPIFRALAGP